MPPAAVDAEGGAVADAAGGVDAADVHAAVAERAGLRDQRRTMLRTPRVTARQKQPVRGDRQFEALLAVLRDERHLEVVRVDDAVPLREQREGRLRVVRHIWCNNKQAY